MTNNLHQQPKQLPNTGQDIIGALIWLSIAALMVLFYFSLLTRRFHDFGSDDIDRNPPIRIYTFDIRKIVKKGNPGENLYGKPPKPGIDWKGLFGF